MHSTRLVFIRHAHTANNGNGPRLVLNGWTELPLTARGRREVELLLEALRGGPSFEAIFSSPLVRALDTARALSDAGLGPLELCDGLKEINCGQLEGVPLDQVQRERPELWRANALQEDEDFRWPEGESYRELRQRCLSTVRGIASRFPGERVALVTHAGVISQVVGWIAGVSAARWERFRPGNASLTEVDWSGDTGVLVRFDERGHLALGVNGW